MRLISQDGIKDCFYETSYLRIKYEEYCLKGEYSKFHKVFSIYANDSNMGEYSTKEKALKVMEMIRHHQQQLIDFDYSAIKGIKDRPSIYFYMPQDDEVHV